MNTSSVSSCESLAAPAACELKSEREREEKRIEKISHAEFQFQFLIPSSAALSIHYYYYYHSLCYNSHKLPLDRYFYRLQKRAPTFFLQEAGASKSVIIFISDDRTVRESRSPRKCPSFSRLWLRHRSAASSCSGGKLSLASDWLAPAGAASLQIGGLLFRREENGRAIMSRQMRRFVSGHSTTSLQFKLGSSSSRQPSLMTPLVAQRETQRVAAAAAAAVETNQKKEQQIVRPPKVRTFCWHLFFRSLSFRALARSRQTCNNSCPKFDSKLISFLLSRAAAAVVVV